MSESIRERGNMIRSRTGNQAKAQPFCAVNGGDHGPDVRVVSATAGRGRGGSVNGNVRGEPVMARLEAGVIRMT